MKVEYYVFNLLIIKFWMYNFLEVILMKLKIEVKSVWTLYTGRNACYKGSDNKIREWKLK